MSLGPYHDELYEQVLPMHGPDPDGLARDLVGAWVHGVIEVDDLVRDSEKGPGWGVILDVDDTPVKGLAWLSQLAGVVLRAQRYLETSEEWAAYARSAIREQNAKRRGTRRAMLDAVRDTLTGTKYANVVERVNGNAYALELVTKPSETSDPDVTVAAAITQKPIGMSLLHVLSEVAIIDEGTKRIDAATGTINTATLSDVAD